MTPVVAQFCENQMTANAKTFSFAAKFFSNENRVAAQALYAWCRYCDDQIDGARSKSEAKIKLAELFRQTDSCLRGQPATELPFQALQFIFREYQIPSVYATELLRGMEMDVEGFTYQTEVDLRLYCYRVAGVVGLMMTHIMGISDQRALKNAAEAGIAMQMTNIARDVAEDLSLGRVYLPATWFAEMDLKPLLVTELMDGNRAWPVTERLLDCAAGSYTLGREGLKSLPLSAAFAISAALDIYEDIGTIIRKRKTRAWDQRAYVPLPRKIFKVVASLVRVAKTGASRLFQPWKPQAISEIYRLQ